MGRELSLLPCRLRSVAVVTASLAHLLACGNVPAAFGTGCCSPGGVLLPLLWERAAPIPAGTEAGNVTSLGVLSFLKQHLA